MTHPSHLTDNFGATNAAARPPLTIETLLQKVVPNCEQVTGTFRGDQQNVTLKELLAMATVYPQFAERRLASVLVRPESAPTGFCVTFQQHIETSGDVIIRVMNDGYSIEDIFLTIVKSKAFKSFTRPTKGEAWLMMSPHLTSLFVDVVKAIVVRMVSPAENIDHPLAVFKPTPSVMQRLSRERIFTWDVAFSVDDNIIQTVKKQVALEHHDELRYVDIDREKGLATVHLPHGRLETMFEVYERVEPTLVGNDMLYLAYWFANAVIDLDNVPINTDDLKADAAEFAATVLLNKVFHEGK